MAKRLVVMSPDGYQFRKQESGSWKEGSWGDGDLGWDSLEDLLEDAADTDGNPTPIIVRLEEVPNGKTD